MTRLDTPLYWGDPACITRLSPGGTVSLFSHPLSVGTNQPTLQRVPGSGNATSIGGIEMNTLLTRFAVKIQSKFVSDDKGATAVEYGLIVGLIAVVLIAGATALGLALNGQFNDISTTIGKL
jgi:pilus assembly protein Flp/PilA